MGGGGGDVENFASIFISLNISNISNYKCFFISPHDEVYMQYIIHMETVRDTESY